VLDRVRTSNQNVEYSDKRAVLRREHLARGGGQMAQLRASLPPRIAVRVLGGDPRLRLTVSCSAAGRHTRHVCGRTRCSTAKAVTHQTNGPAQRSVHTPGDPLRCLSCSVKVPGSRTAIRRRIGYLAPRRWRSSRPQRNRQVWGMNTPPPRRGRHPLQRRCASRTVEQTAVPTFFRCPGVVRSLQRQGLRRHRTAALPAYKWRAEACPLRSSQRFTRQRPGEGHRA